jgi:hypothetical protein
LFQKMVQMFQSSWGTFYWLKRLGFCVSKAAGEEVWHSNFET